MWYGYSTYSINTLHIDIHLRSKVRLFTNSAHALFTHITTVSLHIYIFNQYPYKHAPMIKDEAVFTDGTHTVNHNVYSKHTYTYSINDHIDIHFRSRVRLFPEAPHTLFAHTLFTHTLFTHTLFTHTHIASLHINIQLTHICTDIHLRSHCNTLQHTATRCNTLQHAATRCNTLQHTATHCNTRSAYLQISTWDRGWGAFQRRHAHCSHIL